MLGAMARSDLYFRLPLSWRPRHSEGLTRIGPAEDGGYVIRQAALESTRHVLGGGLSDDWRFEEEFQRRTGANIAIYDPTVDRKFWLKRFYGATKNIRNGTSPLQVIRTHKSYRRFFSSEARKHVRKYIGYDTDDSVSISRILAESGSGRNCFLKIDIEGSEYRVLDDIAAHTDRLTGFVIEFHDVSAHRMLIDAFVRTIGPEFEIAHVHANNYVGSSPDGVPIALEMTFGRPADFAVTQPSPSEYPVAGLDFPCNPSERDHRIDFTADL